uniref:Uncharacterized protein n=1 Tax=Aegilops tauschii TaxID=37682 RepID=M8B6V5_AEGTA
MGRGAKAGATPVEAPQSPPAAAAAEASSTTPATEALSTTPTAEEAPSSAPVDTATGLDSERPVSWSSLADEEEDEDDDDVMAPRTLSPAIKSSVSAARQGVVCDADTCGGWQKGLPRRDVQTPK